MAKNGPRGYTQAELHQQILKAYEAKYNHVPASAHAVAEWAVANGYLTLPQINPMDYLAGQMARSFREEYATDAYGRRYRVNHAVQIMKDGTQTALWGAMDFVDRSHMEKAFAQRREQIIGDCCQLKTDVDVYNSKNSTIPPIQIVFDFTDDIAEREVENEL
jgi:hypothetical protein